MDENKKPGLGPGAFEGNDLAKAVMEITKPYTCFPGTLVNVQCRKIGKTTWTLEPKDLHRLADAVEKALSNFASPLKIQNAKEEILKLLK